MRYFNRSERDRSGSYNPPNYSLEKLACKTHSVIETTTGIDNKNAKALEANHNRGRHYSQHYRTTKLAKMTDFKFYCAFIITENMKVILIK